MGARLSLGHWTWPYTTLYDDPPNILICTNLKTDAWNTQSSLQHHNTPSHDQTRKPIGYSLEQWHELLLPWTTLLTKVHTIHTQNAIYMGRTQHPPYIIEFSPQVPYVPLY
jgi:hypothetical protein